jgi:hypothetical protein
LDKGLARNAKQREVKLMDLLAEVKRCDFCTNEKELREFFQVADEEHYCSVCKDCEQFMREIQEARLGE